MNYESLARTHVDPEPLEFSLRFAKLVATGLWPVRVTLLEQTARMAAATAGISPRQRATHECATRICANFQTS